MTHRLHKYVGTGDIFARPRGSDRKVVVRGGRDAVVIMTDDELAEYGDRAAALFVPLDEAPAAPEAEVVKPEPEPADEPADDEPEPVEPVEPVEPSPLAEMSRSDLWAMVKDRGLNDGFRYQELTAEDMIDLLEG